jgi:hypothetical protein
MWIDSTSQRRLVQYSDAVRYIQLPPGELQDYALRFPHIFDKYPNLTHISFAKTTVDILDRGLETRIRITQDVSMIRDGPFDIIPPAVQWPSGWKVEWRWSITITSPLKRGGRKWRLWRTCRDPIEDEEEHSDEIEVPSLFQLDILRLSLDGKSTSEN